MGADFLFFSTHNLPYYDDAGSQSHCLFSRRLSYDVHIQVKALSKLETSSGVFIHTLLLGVGLMATFQGFERVLQETREDSSLGRLWISLDCDFSIVSI